MWTIYASEVAALIGKNPWRPRFEVYCKLLERHGFLEKFQTQKEQDIEIFQKSYADLYRQLNQGKDVDKKEIENVKQSLKTAVQSVENCGKGKKTEHCIVEESKITQNNNKLYYCNLKKDWIVMYGRIDGFRNGKLIEIQKSNRHINSEIIIYNMFI